MVHIISKRDGPRREDVEAKRLIKENRSTIERLADQFSGGGYSAMRRPPEPPKPSGFMLHDFIAPVESQGRAYVRISLNGRVVLVDADTSRQLHFLGEIRNREFVLASAQNKFFSPLDDDLSLKLADLDHRPIDGDYSEEDLAAEIGERLELE